MTIELRPVADELRESVLALAPHAEQERYAGRPAETLPEADADPLRSPVAIRTYRRAGFRGQGELYHGGAAGPPHVLELEVQPEPLVAD